MKKFLPITAFILCFLFTSASAFAENTENAGDTVEARRVPVPYRFVNKEPIYIEPIQIPVEEKPSKLIEARVSSLAGEAPVRITPVKKISTSNTLLKEGDFVQLAVLSDIKISDEFKVYKGEKVTGLITKLNDNGFNGEEAAVFIEQFEISRDFGQKLYLRGQIKKEGASHNKAITAYSYFLGPAAFWIRGGEVNFRPKRDVYTVYLYNLENLKPGEK